MKLKVRTTSLGRQRAVSKFRTPNLRIRGRAPSSDMTSTWNMSHFIHSVVSQYHSKYRQAPEQGATHACTEKGLAGRHCKVQRLEGRFQLYDQGTKITTFTVLEERGSPPGFSTKRNQSVT